MSLQNCLVELSRRKETLYYWLYSYYTMFFDCRNNKAFLSHSQTRKKLIKYVCSNKIKKPKKITAFARIILLKSAA